MRKGKGKGEVKGETEERGGKNVELQSEDSVERMLI